MESLPERPTVVNLAEERRRRGFGPVEEPTIDTASIDEAVARHPAGRNRQPADLFLGEDEIAEMASFIETNREDYVVLMKRIMERTGGVIIAKHIYEEIKEFKETKGLRQAGRAVIEAILNDEDDASSDQLIYGSGQDS